MKTKLLITLMIVFGVFLFVGAVSASDAETLQPAATITYNEDVTVNGTLRTDSIYIGEEGVGGVTFFNGSIVNIGATTPVTIADDLRVDGEIFRTVKGTSSYLKISNHVWPTEGNKYNLGDNSKKWNKLHVNEGIFSQVYSYTEEDYISAIFAGTDNPKAYAARFEGRMKISGVDGSQFSCTDNYGDIIFSTTDLGNGANQFYGCTGTGWRRL